MWVINLDLRLSELGLGDFRIGYLLTVGNIRTSTVPIYDYIGKVRINKMGRDFWRSVSGSHTKSRASLEQIAQCLVKWSFESLQETILIFSWNFPCCNLCHCLSF